ncbi:MAG: hypothetical protein NTW16_05625 [Bacteroidetes bacterium]|nr:hypothetical protein [Bacteroidota bacterium]
MSTENDLTKTYSGIFGNQVVLKNRRSKSVMTIPPVKPVKEPSEKQLATRRRLSLAAQYAKDALQDPALREMYAAKSHKSPYRVAVNDFLRPPYVHLIDASGYHGNPGETISVTAGDDFKLTAVTVKITGSDGVVIESGPCVMVMPTGNYDYVATSPVSNLAGVTITASARDIPGHVTQRSITL